ncbi:MAG: dihydroorotate dehydrogenase [Candidatus Marinimicrobia bacterium]|nr:dihydroorotate dehydrogenase [Candidatus Neomarinimicrobiota bacterium]
MSVRLRDDFILDSPILPASGTFGYGDELIDIVNLDYYGGLITKTITLEEREGNPPERIFETKCGMLNSIGLANIGLKRFLKEKSEFLKNLRIKKIINIAGNTEDEYLRIVEDLDKYNWIDGYEINVSCPNVDKGGIQFGKDCITLSNLISKVRKLTKKLLIVKLSPNVDDIVSIARVCNDNGADAITLINTVYGCAIDIYKKKPVINRVIAGYSGPAIKPIAIANVIRVKSEVNIPIIGVGGIFSSEDAIEFILAGASAIQIGTAHFNNPLIAEEIYNFIVEYCRKNGILNIADLVGAALK